MFLLILYFCADNLCRVSGLKTLRGLGNFEMYLAADARGVRGAPLPRRITNSEILIRTRV